MTATSPSSSAQSAREALAVRLQHLRKVVGLTGNELSARCGWDPAKTTRIQKGEALPSDTDIRTCCTACYADDQADDLIAAARVAPCGRWRRSTCTTTPLPWWGR
jgi:transcriptional regulator with XRE-family HTH domain